MSGLRTVLGSSALVGVIGIGYGMWSIIAPGDERKRELVKNLPEANPVRMEETRRKNALMMQVLKDASETTDNVARGSGGSPK